MKDIGDIGMGISRRESHGRQEYGKAKVTGDSQEDKGETPREDEKYRGQKAGGKVKDLGDNRDRL